MHLDEIKQRVDNIYIKGICKGGKAMNTVVTISRQFGSGGRLIGKMLAQRLGVPFYDKEIIVQAAQNCGFAQEFIEDNEQKRNGLSSFSVSPAWIGIAPANCFDNFEAKIFAAEANAIESFACNGACVIVGRCADYVLRDNYDCLNVFVYADIDSRIKRVLEVYNDATDVKKAQKLIRDKDKNRARHYKYYTDTEWGKACNYDLCIDSAKFGIDACVDLLFEAYKMYDGKQN